jgi:hypothetical protein
MTNSQIIMKAMREARGILADYVEPGPRDCEATINRLLAVLDCDVVGKAVAFIDAELLMRNTLAD